MVDRCHHAMKNFTIPPSALVSAPSFHVFCNATSWSLLSLTFLWLSVSGCSFLMEVSGFFYRAASFKGKDITCWVCWLKILELKFVRCSLREMNTNFPTVMEFSQGETNLSYKHQPRLWESHRRRCIFLFMMHHNLTNQNKEKNCCMKFFCHEEISFLFL